MGRVKETIISNESIGTKMQSCALLQFHDTLRMSKFDINFDTIFTFLLE